MEDVTINIGAGGGDIKGSADKKDLYGRINDMMESKKILLDILQELGIVDDNHTGSVVLHLAEGSLVSYDVNRKGRFKDLVSVGSFDPNRFR